MEGTEPSTVLSHEHNLPAYIHPCEHWDIVLSVELCT
jgi:hypothetical protein